MGRAEYYSIITLLSLLLIGQAQQLERPISVVVFIILFIGAVCYGVDAWFKDGEQ